MESAPTSCLVADVFIETSLSSPYSELPQLQNISHLDDLLEDKVTVEERFILPV